MARLIRHNASAPQEVKAGSVSIWVCMCGLSRTYPLCDGTHKCTRAEAKDKLYRYEGDKPVETPDPGGITSVG